MAKALVLFGTLTYNTETVAQRVFETLEQANYFEEVTLRNSLEVSDPHELEGYDLLIFGTSTWGEGDYPPDMEEFMILLQNSVVDLANKPVAIFGLGETSYENFCWAADNLKELLSEQFKANLIGETHKIDGYPEDPILDSAAEWTNQIVEIYKNLS